MYTVSVAGQTERKSTTEVTDHPQVDPNGYLFFCLCMGRFGNQATHFLGGLAMAKRINRTLVLPPFQDGDLVPFGDWFNVSRLAEYHRVVTAADFLENIAPTQWPSSSRIGMCFRYPQHETPCTMDETDHHFTFWKKQDIKFVRTESYMLSYDAHSHHTKAEWDARFPASSYPVLALQGAPGGLPMQKLTNGLHQYLQWSNAIAVERDAVIRDKIPSGKYVGIHIRNAQDWDNACQHTDSARGSSYMAAPQCVGYDAGLGTVTKEICLPSRESIAQETAEAVRRVGAKYVFIATPHDPMLKDIQTAVGVDVKLLHLKLRPILDLAVLAKSDHFIGNCVSSFSAFVRRERDSLGLSTSFFGHGVSHLSPRVHDDL